MKVTSSIATVVYKMISPLIRETIQITVASANSSLKTTYVNPIVDADTGLRGFVGN